MAAQKHPMETYHGIVRTPADAIKLFEACRLGLLPRVQRRLSEKERQAIRSGSVFVWDEREAGMRRWTDGKSWSASRVSGSFLTYREMEGKRGGGFNTLRRVSGKTPDSTGRGSDEDQDDGEPDGYRYKADGLMKQSFSITTSNGQHLHLISYYARPAPGEPELPHPTTDPALRSVVPVKGMYPESSMSDNTPIPVVSRAPMGQQQHHHHHVPPPPYAHHGPPPPLSTAHHQPYPPPYGQQSAYSWPPSPIATPPYNHHYTTSSATAYSQQQPAQASLPPPPSSYYPGHQPPPYEHRMSLPPPQSTLPALSRSTPPYSQPAPTQAAAQPFASSHHHHLSTSPRSLHRQPLPSVSAASSAAAASYATPPGSRSNLPPVSLALPVLSSTAAVNGGPPPALTPPRRLSPSPTTAYGKPYVSAAELSPSAVNNKASLSALLHPTPASSEPNSARAGSTNSAGSSPRYPGMPAPLAANGVRAVSPTTNGTTLAPLPQQFLQPAPSGEDTRALSRLDRKFCI